MPNGVLNNPPVIRVRGVNSISLSSFPLVVIDGVPTFTGNAGGTASNNVLGDINPADIESMEVLKDAAAAAIYGSRASSGVLLITTKKGRGGRARVNYDGWVGWTKAFNLIEVLNATEYTTIKNEGLTNLGTPPVPAPGTPARGFFTMNDANGNLVDTRWYDYVYRNGMQQNHSVNVSGANDRTSYYF
jgi:TonB-dependent SusC/RagA subfamily outer membrane receptor